MAKVTDIQDKNGVSKEIQDKDLANRTSQSTIASTDYVLLEDTDGAYHKIAKASFTEAVRGALGSVINSVAKGTDIAKIPVLDSSNDLGMGTLANVASVLGVITNSPRFVSKTNMLWEYSNDTYKNRFESWYNNSAENGIYFGMLRAGWTALIIGFKTGDYGHFIKVSYGNNTPVTLFCDIDNGTFSWGE